MLKKILVVFVLFNVGCQTQKRIAQRDKTFLENLMKQEPGKFGSFLANRDSLHLQVIYTRIDRTAGNKPYLKDFTFHVNDNDYFYPASTVKMPVALLALEKLNNLKVNGVNRDAIMITDSSYGKQDFVFNLPTAKDGKPTIGQYTREIFLVSDNNAFNRLYEFLGQQYINDKLHEKGFRSAQIIHRLSIPLSEDENRHTNAISFYDTSGREIYNQAAQFNAGKFPLRSENEGKGYYQSGSLISQPFDFSGKNRVSLTDLHTILKSVYFPNAVLPSNRFNLSNDDVNFLHRYMSMKPKESKYPVFDTAQYGDNYVKFLLMGSEKTDMPPNIRIFNKVGDAYGYLTDVAYIVDFKNKIEFMLSATLLCNSDGIFNDDKYDYNTVGLPFMKNLGELIYQYEIKRKRKHVPDLANLEIDYTSGSDY